MNFLKKCSYKFYIFTDGTDGNINILKSDSNSLSEPLVQNSDINECIKSEIDGRIENELESSNDNYV